MPKAVLNLLKDSSSKIARLILESNKTEKQEKTTRLLKSIEATISNAYPNAKAYAFGSRISYLGFPESDLDVFLDCEKTYYTKASHEKSLTYMNAVTEYFKNQIDEWIIDEILCSTRVPILKLRHIPTALKCDISFANGLGVEKSKLLR